MGNAKEIDTMVDGTLNLTQEIIDKYGPRLAGNKSTHDVAELFYDEYSKNCDSVEKQEFNVYPKSFFGWIKLLCGMYIFSTVMLFLQYPLLSAITTTLGLIIMVLQFFYYIPFIDKLYRKKKGVNVIGSIEPSGKVEKQIIISGHHDSAYILNFLIHQPKLYAVRILGGVGFVVLMCISSWIIWIIELVTDNFPLFGTIWAWISIFSFILVIQLWFFASNKGTNGAGDNLISSVITLKMGEYLKTLKSQGSGLKNTRIIIATFDAEEAGLRGARNYCKEHKKELLSLPTYNINMDCLYNVEDLFFLITDVNGTIKLSKKLAENFVDIAKSLGYKTKTKPIEFLTGGTDAAEFARIGVKAISILGMPWGNSNHNAVYHTPKDNVDSIDPKAIKATIKILLNFIQSSDDAM